jgi:hypothetical protein
MSPKLISNEYDWVLLVQWITGISRGTPIGATDIIAGYTARILTLPDNHLLKMAWHMDIGFPTITAQALLQEA